MTMTVGVVFEICNFTKEAKFEFQKYSISKSEYFEVCMFSQKDMQAFAKNTGLLMG